jgi:hypothetical protein
VKKKVFLGRRERKSLRAFLDGESASRVAGLMVGFKVPDKEESFQQQSEHLVNGTRMRINFSKGSGHYAKIMHTLPTGKQR